MKTYFMAWSTDKKEGHAIYDFADDVTPRLALKRMMELVEIEIPEVRGQLRAAQFNRVD